MIAHRCADKQTLSMCSAGTGLTLPRGRCSTPLPPALRAASVPRQLHRCISCCASEARCRDCKRLPCRVSVPAGLAPAEAVGLCCCLFVRLMVLMLAFEGAKRSRAVCPAPDASLAVFLLCCLQGPPLCRLACPPRQRRSIHGCCAYVCAATGGGGAEPGFQGPACIRQVRATRVVGGAE